MLCLLVSYFHHVTIHVIQTIFLNEFSWNSHVFKDSTHQYCNFLCYNVVVLATFYWRRWLKAREQNVRKAIITSKAHMLLLIESTLSFAFCFSCLLFLRSMIRILNLHLMKNNNKGFMDIMELWVFHLNSSQTNSGLYQCVQTLSYVWVRSRNNKCVNYH